MFIVCIIEIIYIEIIYYEYSGSVSNRISIYSQLKKGMGYGDEQCRPSNFCDNDKREKKNIFAFLEGIKKLFCIKIKRLFSTELPENSVKKITVARDFSLFYKASLFA